MKNYCSPFIFAPLLIVSALTLLVIGLPLQVQAHPALGLTPTSTPSTVDPPPPPSPTPIDPGFGPPNIDISLNCDLICPVPGESVSVSIPIQLVHPGSGATVDTTLSNFGRTSISVPFEGTWQVIMTGSPQIYPDLGNDFPATYPVSLGSVVTNGGTQTLDCPITPVCDVPNVFPQTGAYDSLPYTLLFSLMTIVVMLITGSISIKRSRRQKYL